MHSAFANAKGVRGVEMGFIGGWRRQVTQLDVLKGGTGHAEAVRIAYDDSTTFGALQEIFYAAHDALSLYKQGGDIGVHVRSAVWAQTTEQLKSGRSRLRKLKLEGKKVITAMHDCRTPLEKEKQKEGNTDETALCDTTSFLPAMESQLRYHCAEEGPTTDIAYDAEKYVARFKRFTAAETSEFAKALPRKDASGSAEGSSGSGSDSDASDSVEASGGGGGVVKRSVEDVEEEMIVTAQKRSSEEKPNVEDDKEDVEQKGGGMCFVFVETVSVEK